MDFAEGAFADRGELLVLRETRGLRRELRGDARGGCCGCCLLLLLLLLCLHIESCHA